MHTIWIGPNASGLVTERDKLVTASRVPGLLCIKGAYDSLKQTVLNIQGKRKPITPYTQLLFDYGNMMEPIINTLYEDCVGVHVNRCCRFMANLDYPVYGSPDGLVIDPVARTVQVIEYKAKSEDTTLPGQPSPQHFVQVQVLMGIVDTHTRRENGNWFGWHQLPAHLVYYHEEEGMRIFDISLNMFVNSLVQQNIYNWYNYINENESVPKRNPRVDITDFIRCSSTKI